MNAAGQAEPRVRGQLRESADMHRRIYQAIRKRDAAGARAAMDEHIRLAQVAQASEEATAPTGVNGSPKEVSK